MEYFKILLVDKTHNTDRKKTTIQYFPVADLWGANPFFFHFLQFSEKIMPNNRLASPGSPGILDPPLNSCTKSITLNWTDMTTSKLFMIKNKDLPFADFLFFLHFLFSQNIRLKNSSGIILSAIFEMHTSDVNQINCLLAKNTGPDLDSDT